MDSIVVDVFFIARTMMTAMPGFVQKFFRGPPRTKGPISNQVPDPKPIQIG